MLAMKLPLVLLGLVCNLAVRFAEAQGMKLSTICWPFKIIRLANSRQAEAARRTEEAVVGEAASNARRPSSSLNSGAVSLMPQCHRAELNANLVLSVAI